MGSGGKVFIVVENVDELLKLYDVKKVKNIDKVIRRKLIAQVKKDIKTTVKFNFTSAAAKLINKNITSSSGASTGKVRAGYIAYFHNAGVKERHPRKHSYMYFETPASLIRTKIVAGYTGKRFMEQAENRLDGGYYDEFISNVLDEEIKKIENGGSSEL